MISGIVLIDKASGPTSMDVVRVLRKRLGEKRVGHCGTLDPLASGLLVCLLGSATRFASFGEHGKKTYTGTIQLGLSTSTDDVTGEELGSSDLRPSEAELRSAVKKFTGPIKQIPPQYSAVKVDGKRAYALARDGLVTELKPRTVEISEFEISLVDASTASFRIVCSKGTYIRSLARDIGAILGCGACIATLRREASEPFSVTDAVLVDDVSQDNLRPWSELFPRVGRIEVSETEAVRLRSGHQPTLEDITANLRPEAEQNQQKLAIYVAQESKQALGLLVRKNSNWSFGVNL